MVLLPNRLFDICNYIFTLMSRDIRSYFQTKGSRQDTDKIRKNENVKTKTKKRVIVIDSDSDDDLFPSLSKKRLKADVQHNVKKDEQSPKLKPVTISDVLGNEHVKRSSKTVSSTNRKNSVKTAPSTNKIDSDLKNNLLDNDFNTSWEKLDELESQYFNDCKSFTTHAPSTSSSEDTNKPNTAINDLTMKRSDNNQQTPKSKRQKVVNKSTEKSGTAEKHDSNSTQNESVNSKHDTQTPKHGKIHDFDQIQSSEKKKGNALNYIKYLNREGPKHPGSKQIPEGIPNCLSGLVFVITGVLDSLDRDGATDLIKKYGGRVTHTISRNTNYVIIGDDAGPAKLEKAKSLNIHQLDEDGLLNLIKLKSESANSNVNKEHAKKKANKALKYDNHRSNQTKSSTAEVRTSNNTSKINLTHNTNDVNKKITAEASTSNNAGKIKLTQNTNDVNKTSVSDLVVKDKLISESSLWVDKYRPRTLKQIIGQQGEKSVVNKLLKWLSNWHKNQSKKKTTKPSPWAKDDDGSYFKAALLSGPPGIGKTTTAHLVSKELGFDIVEFNASDTRSKKLLHAEVSELLSNKSIYGYFHGASKTKPSENHVLIMDEVDGMAGNEDRGGIQELIQLIKNSHIPIICMCNDRNHPKIRSLANYCFDLRVSKPRLEQIRGAMMSICFKEGLKIPADALTEIISAANQDLRQVLHHLSVLSANNKNLSVDEVKFSARNAKKQFKLGPWDVLKKVFSAEDHKSMSIHDKSDLFFHDYNISPLFVHENYLSVTPIASKGNINNTLELISKTADSISMGDIIEKTIRTTNSWNMLPVQAMFSSVIPGEYMEGYLRNQINFPSWLGKNSRANKFERLSQELQFHMRLAISGSKRDISLDYLSCLRDAIVKPLQKDGVDGVSSVIKTLQNYYLTREDIESLLELSTWPNQKDPMSGVESKVKAALTRAYNKSGFTAPYSVTSAVKKKAGGSMDFENEEDQESDNEASGDDLSMDAMIKIKKKSSKKADESAKQTESKRGKGRGKAKL